MCLHYHAGGDTFEDSINKIICKVSFVRPKGSVGSGSNKTLPTSTGGYEWHDGTPLDPAERATQGLAGAPPPALLPAFEWPEGCTPAYRVPCLKVAFSKHWATDSTSPGSVHAATYDNLEKALRLPPGGVDPRLKHPDGKHYLVRERAHAWLALLCGWLSFFAFSSLSLLSLLSLLAWCPGRTARWGP